MKNTGLILWSSILSIFLFMTSSCERSEGEGGKATIEGFIYKIVDDGTIVKRDTFYYNKEGEKMDTTVYSFVRDTIIAADEDVYIIYGGDAEEHYGDKTKTSYNGKYRFQYLVEGNYSVYAYNNLPDKLKTPEIHSLRIGKKGVNEVPQIYVRDGKNTGLCGVVGRVRVKYDNTRNPNGIPIMDVRVFIKRDSLEAPVLAPVVAPVDDTRTDENGYFVFTKLTPGKYKVWAATEEYTTFKDQYDAKIEMVEIPQTLNADGTGQIIYMGNIIIAMTNQKP